MQTILEYIKSHKLVILMAFSSLSLFLGFMPDISLLYYISLVCLALYALIKKEYISKSPILFLLGCVLSLCLSGDISIFKPWPRLCLFAILMFAVYPIFDSEELQRIRTDIFRLSIAGCVIAGATAVPCYIIGINYQKIYWSGVVYTNNVGLFGGLTRHSMLLGIVAAIGFIAMLYLFFFTKRQKIRILSLTISFACLCGTFISASRGATIAALGGGMSLIWILKRNSLSKLFKTFFTTVILALVFSPAYSPYLTPVIQKQAENEKKGNTFSSRASRWDHRWEEFTDNPLFGVGFAAIDPKHTDEYDTVTGVIETGSSWLSAVSMIGLLGIIPMFYMIYKTTKGLYRKSCDDSSSALILSILIVYYIHMVVEGYLFAGGNFLCFLFWLTLGIGHSRIMEYDENRSIYPLLSAN